MNPVRTALATLAVIVACVSHAETVAPKVQFPPDLTQYLAEVRGSLIAVPRATVASNEPSTTVTVVTGVDQLRHLPRYVQIRQAYGGVYPYVVVNARERFVIISREGDVLVVGVPNPKKAVVQQQQGLRLTPQPDGTLVATPIQKQPVNIMYFETRIDPSVQLPPGIPSDLLKRQDLTGRGSRIEPSWNPNGRRCYSVSAQPGYDQVADTEGHPFRVYKVNLD